MPFIRKITSNDKSNIGGITPTISTNLDPITYNPRYPGFDEANYKKLEAKIDGLGLTGYQKEQAMDEAYQQVLPMVQNQIKNSDRRKYINEAQYEVSQMPEGNDKKVANGKLSVVQLTQLVKEKYDIDPSAPDEQVFNDWLATVPNGEQLLADYMNTGDKTLLYESGLAEKPKETGWQKAEDFAVGVLQSPGKWGYNMVGQWADKVSKRAGEGAASMLSNEQKEKVVDWLDKNTIFKRDRIEEYAQELARQEAEGTTFNGRENTDITKPRLGEERAKSGWTKGGEVVGDIATGIAMSYPLGAALAPAMTSGTAGEAALLGAIEGGIDTIATQYGSEGNLDISPIQGILGMVGGAAGGWLTNKLANMPKSDVDKIRKEAEGYINKSIKPKVNTKMSASDVDKFTDNVLDVTDWMTKNKDILQYTDDAGEVITGKLPTNLKETTETLGNLKSYIYSQYDDIAKKAGGAGARVDLNSVFDKLDDLTRDVPQNLGNSNTLNIVDDFKNRLLQFSDDAGTISIQDAQKTVQEYNHQLSSFFKNISNSSDDVGRLSITAKVNKWLNDSIDNSIDDALNQGINTSSPMSNKYREFKHLYGQIKNIEGEISKRTLQELKKSGGLSNEILDALSGGEFTQAVLTADPIKLAKAGAMKAISSYIKRAKDPNVNINKLFKLVDSINNPGKIQKVVSSVSQNVGNPIRETLQNSANIIPEVVVPGGISAGEAVNNLE